MLPENEMAIVRLFEEMKPKTLEQIELLGLKPEKVGAGCSRICYRLSQNIVVKLEAPRGCHDGQNKMEVMVLRTIHSEEKFAPIRVHVPPLYYGDEVNGVVLTQYYPSQTPVERNEERYQLARKLEDFGLYDGRENNFRMDTDGNLVMIDVGYPTMKAREANWFGKNLLFQQESYGKSKGSTRKLGSESGHVTRSRSTVETES